MEDEDEYAYKKHTGFNSGYGSDSDSKSDFDESYIAYKPPPCCIEDFNMVKIYPFTLVRAKIKLPKHKPLKRNDQPITCITKSTSLQTLYKKDSKNKEFEELEEFYKYQHGKTTLKDYFSSVLCKLTKTSKKSPNMKASEMESFEKGMEKSKPLTENKKTNTKNNNSNVQHGLPTNFKVKVNNNSLKLSQFTKNKGTKSDIKVQNAASQLNNRSEGLKSLGSKNQNNDQNLIMEEKLGNLYKSKSLTGIHTKPIKSGKEMHNKEISGLNTHSLPKSRKSKNPGKPQNEIVQVKQEEKTINKKEMSFEKNKNENRNYYEKHKKKSEGNGNSSSTQSKKSKQENVAVFLKKNTGNAKKDANTTESVHNLKKSKSLNNLHQLKSRNGQRGKNNNILNEDFKDSILYQSEGLNTKKSKKKK